VTTLGVVGAGTMGAGIAQLGCAAGMPTLLHDPVPEALERGAENVRKGLAKWAEKGRADAGAADLLEPVQELEGLAGCDLVIEAAPERSDLKRELFERLSEVCGDDAVLASNTSSITVTGLAGAAAKPENVVGMHFFNPPPQMELLEVIRADQSGDRAVSLATEVGEAMGKRVILAADGPGFLVNRCGRPFNAEALRLVQERLATPEQVDRIVRLGGGFRMGPFELMDLVGIDVGFEVAKSFTELSFGEPRWKPSPLQARMVAAGRLGRKTGRGWYEYEKKETEKGLDHRGRREEPLEPSGGNRRPVVVHGAGPLVEELRERCRAADYETVEGEGPETMIDLEGGACLVLCAGSSLALSSRPDGVGFHLLPGSSLVELTGRRDGPAEGFFQSIGLHTEWVGDAPGLVLGRIVCQLVNEAAFALGEGVGSAEDIDDGMTLGLNHPRGPVAWSETIGLDHVLAVLDGLWEERREERYRAAPLLRSGAASLREWRPPT
jgi:3-hydroxybutyryl-CoA dehydrogenase